MIPGHHVIKFDDPRVDGPDFVDLDTGAKRMGLTVKQVISLIRTGALRYERVGGETYIQPAIVTGATPE